MHVETKSAPPADDIKSLIEAQGRAFEEFKQANDERLAQVEKKGAAAPETADKVMKLDAALADFGDQIRALGDRLHTAEVLARTPGGARGNPLDPAAAEHRQAFLVYARKGMDAGLADLERKSMSVGTDPDGGYLVPADMSGRIVTRIFESSPIRQIASVTVVSTDALEGIRDTDEAGGGWVAETGTRSETTTPQLAKWRIGVNEMYAEPRATQQLLDDSAVDVAAWLVAKIADKLARIEAAAFVVGDGTGKPRGFTTYATAATADSSRAWGTFEHVATGVNGDFAASNPGDHLVQLVYKTKAGYRQGAVWVMPKAVVSKVRQFKEATTNAYIWQPGLQAGQPSSLLGFPVVEAEDMPALATGSLSLAFGNFGLAYQIVDRQGIRVLRDPFTAKPYVKFYTTRRVGGDVVQFEAVKFIKFS